MADVLQAIQVRVLGVPRRWGLSPGDDDSALAAMVERSPELAAAQAMPWCGRSGHHGRRQDTPRAPR